MAALKAGQIGASELANWRAVTANPLMRLLAMSAYIRARLLASPMLPRVLGIEVGVGCLTTLAAESAARGERFGKELDFVLANQVLIMITNMALVLALAQAETCSRCATGQNEGRDGAGARTSCCRG